ncbi:hypothetical protein D9619_005963 [Psilocybe cf. subviscida]|uniref:NYN domain-containing protein n=1 Tax=Psilocybe cf. subviscida TaxID=2480587 RepID=A0A8H5FBF9_9AGAR|nr:hypothetical protein D9619_005963 [Psilocybe cf. subviscida]
MMEDVAIFWDYENCPAPANTSGYALVQSIRLMARSYGSVKTLKAYAGIAEQFTVPRTQSLRSELQCSGVSLIDCPHNGRKDVADKMMIVDMLAHAIDNPSPSTIVLISGDRDFAYALSILRLRCYRTILCTTSNAHLSLVAQASGCIDWASLCAAAVDVLAPQWPIPNQPATPKIPISRLNSQREVPASKASRDLKEEDGTIPPVRERKRSTISFPSTSSVFANPKSVVEFIPSSSKQPASVFKWPNSGGSPKKSYTNVDFPKFQPSQMFNMAGEPSSNDTITEAFDVSTAVSANSAFAQNVAGSPLKSTLTFMDNDIEDDDNLQHPTSNSNDSDDYTISNEAPESQGNSQTDKAPSTLPLPDFILSSNHSSVFAPHLESPFGILNSNQEYIPSFTGSKPNVFGALKPPASPKRFNYSAGVPPHFVILIKVLQAQLKEGKERILRCQVGEQISHKGVTYQKAGANNFSEYVAMAERAGIVELGGSEGKAWIALTSDCRTIYVA